MGRRRTGRIHPARQRDFAYGIPLFTTGRLRALYGIVYPCPELAALSPQLEFQHMVVRDEHEARQLARVMSSRACITHQGLSRDADRLDSLRHARQWPSGRPGCRVRATGMRGLADTGPVSGRTETNVRLPWCAVKALAAVGARKGTSRDATLRQLLARAQYASTVSQTEWAQVRCPDRALRQTGVWAVRHDKTLDLHQTIPAAP